MFDSKSDHSALTPRYDLIHQSGLDAQATWGQWLWKLEMIRRESHYQTFLALTGGFEYTLSNLLSSGFDWGIIAEYLYDVRGNETSNPFEDDVMLGSRLGFNDTQSTEALIGIIFDRSSSSKFLNLEASRRLGTKWKLSLEARVFSSISEKDLLFSYRRDDTIQLKLARYFK
ncbi:MAG: hypothetical protein HYY63_01560 [Elusimicrobia bacterium]|nr:hypothetical protein [Elusimicrobiota bacterium]